MSGHGSDKKERHSFTEKACWLEVIRIAQMADFPKNAG